MSKPIDKIFIPEGIYRLKSCKDNSSKSTQKMASFPLLLLLFSLIPPSLSQTCTTQKFTNNKLYAHCLDLPSLTSYLHFTYDPTNTTLSLAFISTPSKSDGWVSWALNPTALKMPGSQALVAFKDSSGSLSVKTYNVSSYSSNYVVQSKLLFDVWDTSAESDASSGAIRIFAKIKVPEDLAAKGSINQVWQVGPSVDSTTGALTPHDIGTANLKATATLDLNGTGSSPNSGGNAGGGVDSRTKRKNIHGVLNVVSWGILFPVGVIIARYMRVFQSADPAWFYLHVSCQVSAYGIGVAGWATGMKLGSESKGIVWSGHRNIGITLFAIATLQVFALFLRPKKEHKIRVYWNRYHWTVGYTIIILGIVNIFKGFDILQPEKKWKSAYIIVIVVLAVIAALLEVFTWIVVLRRKSNKSTKPYDGFNNGQLNVRQQTLNA